MAKLISFNTENEQVIISSMCTSTAIRKKLSFELIDTHFIGSKHQVLFRALKQMAHKNDDFHEDTLNQYADGEFGGFKYIRKLLEAYPEPNPNIDRHIQVLLSDAARVKSQKFDMPKIQEALDDPHIDPTAVIKLLDSMKARFTGAVNKDIILYGQQLKKEYMLDLKMRSDEGIFIGSQLPELDAYFTEGFARKKCSVIGARPSMGKTTTVSVLSRKQADAGIKVCLVPIESGSISALDSMVADLTGIDLYTLVKNTKQIDFADKKKIMKALDSIVANDNLHVIEDPSLTLDRFGAILANGNYDVAYLDLFERLYDIAIRPDALSERLRTVQRIAKETNTHISLVHQIHRINRDKKEKHPNLRPSMEMLKNSGAYEEIADLILLLHRDRYYNPEATEDIMEIIIAKQRKGERDKTVGFQFVGQFGRLGTGFKDYKPQSTRDMEEF